jgi:hypothetical protein
MVLEPFEGTRNIPLLCRKIDVKVELFYVNSISRYIYGLVMVTPDDIPFLSIRSMLRFARFEVFTAVKIQVEVSWIATPCCVLAGYQRFCGPCCLHFQGEMALKMEAACYMASQPRRSRVELCVLLVVLVAA